MEKTMRRDSILKKAKAGKLQIVRYSYSSECEYINEKDINLVVHVHADPDDTKQGFWNVPERHFKGRYGSALLNDNGEISLYTCGGPTYHFREIAA
jgi:hypothetical protein